MDQENLDKQMHREEERAGQLRRKHLEPADIERTAASTKFKKGMRYVADAEAIH